MIELFEESVVSMSKAAIKINETKKMPGRKVFSKKEC